MPSWRDLSPFVVGFFGVALFVIALVLALAGGFDPFGFAKRRLAGAEAAAETAADDAAARTAEVAGERAVAARVDVYTHQVARAERSVDAFILAAEEAARDVPVPPFDPARAARLRAHDDELCQLAPTLDGCAPAADPAGDR